MFLHEKFMKAVPGALSEHDDIVANLQNILSTKRGCGSFLRNFGLSETGYKTPAEQLNSITREIKENILLYEPRVELLEIDDLFDEGTGRTRLIFTLRIRDGNRPLHFSIDPRLRKLQLTPLAVEDTEFDAL